MTRKLLALTILLGLTAVASSAPRAEASAPPCDLVCDGRTNLICTCPLASDVPGRSSNCFSWQGTGPHGCFLP